MDENVWRIVQRFEFIEPFDIANTCGNKVIIEKECY